MEKNQPKQEAGYQETAKNGANSMDIEQPKTITVLCGRKEIKVSGNSFS